MKLSCVKRPAVFWRDNNSPGDTRGTVDTGTAFLDNLGMLEVDNNIVDNDIGGMGMVYNVVADMDKRSMAAGGVVVAVVAVEVAEVMAVIAAVVAVEVVLTPALHV